MRSGVQEQEIISCSACNTGHANALNANEGQARSVILEVSWHLIGKNYMKVWIKLLYDENNITRNEKCVQEKTLYK